MSNHSFNDFITPFNEVENRFFELNFEDPKLKELLHFDLKVNYLLTTFKFDSVYNILLNSQYKDSEIAIDRKLHSFLFSRLYSSLKFHNYSIEYLKLAMSIEIPQEQYVYFSFLSDEFLKSKLAYRYRMIKNYKKSNELFEEVIDSYISTNQYKSLHSVFRIYVNNLIALNDLKTVKTILEKFNKKEYLDNLTFAQGYYTLLAYYYYLVKDIEKAITYEKQSLVYRKKLGDKKLIMNGYVTIAKFYNANLQLDSAKIYFDFAEEFFAKNKSLNSSGYFYESIINYYKNINDTINTLKAEQVLRSIQNEEALVEHILSVTEKIISKNEEISKVKFSNTILTEISVIIFILLLLIFYFYYRLKNKESILKEKSNDLENEIRSHIETHKNLEYLISEKNKLIGLISHDLINPLGASISLLNIAIETYNKKDDEMSEILLAVRSSITENKKMLNQIMSWVVSSQNQRTFAPESSSIYNITEEVLDSLSSQISNKSINVDNKLIAGLTAWFDPNQIKVVIRNIIQNALKFTPENGRIVVDNYTENNYIFITIQDNGIGIEENKIKHLFNSQRLTFKNKQNESSGYGFGLVISKEFIALNRGDIFVDSKLHHGTKFTIKLPMYEKV
ncbi:HAMP domain-containing sensor histidine kinase [Candidatus Kapabacteria bacterium]|nr:HAMP domain-containing sensor histidine kinase [Candidatus Kapabacteria bacterium]